VTPLPRGVDGHDEPHLFRGVCICSCQDCTRTVGRDGVQCVCPACDGTKCGARVAFALTVGAIR
jgi:hypothetical protein